MVAAKNHLGKDLTFTAPGNYNEPKLYPFVSILGNHPRQETT